MRILYCFIFIGVLLSCKPSYEEPYIPLDGYELAEGFEIEVMASEPLLKAPVAIDFDSKGRIWAVEMTGYMLTPEGEGEDEPTGTIKILEDLDGDGTVDHAKVVLDSLVMPRALALVYGGLLYAEPPNLWFAEIEDDVVTKKVLVDSLYAADGNPEHQPNGLLLHLDNWIYSAGSTARYQRKNGKWLKQKTSYRGQWGITKDNFGRLYYNNNSTQLLGDFMLPNSVIRNKFHLPKNTINQVLTANQKVYPIYETPVNRGYQEGVLDADSLLIEVTSACGPFVYRGGAFGKAFENNVFVCIPEANLIKRNILNYDGAKVTATQARDSIEFLAANDQGFRPVNMASGPDGNLYVVDMHRGLLQHYAFLSPYLKKKSKEKQLDTIINSGRIIRIRNSETKTNSDKPILLDELSDLELVALLQHKNGWFRDQAQHRLVYQKHLKMVPRLEKIAVDTLNPMGQLHALYTLKGLDSLRLPTLLTAAKNGGSETRAHAIVLLENLITKQNIDSTKALFSDLLAVNDSVVDLYLMSSLGTWSAFDNDAFMPMLASLLDKYHGNPIYEDALLSGASKLTDTLVKQVKLLDKTKTEQLQKLLAASIERKNENKPNSIFSDDAIPMDSRTKGAKLYAQICAACHLTSGEGIPQLAPPLVGSEHVADSKRLALIILHGLKGPVEVNGKKYEFNGAMSGLAANDALSDKDISDLINYVANAFSSKWPPWYSTDDIAKFRKLTPINGEFTSEELDQLSEKK